MRREIRMSIRSLMPIALMVAPLEILVNKVRCGQNNPGRSRTVLQPKMLAKKLRKFRATVDH